MTRRDILTAVPVAFHEDGRLDLDGSREILEYVAKSGNEGAFVLGTTGEFPALSFEERGALTALSLEVLAPVMRVVVHVGGASVYDALRYLQQAREAGATEVAVLTPYYLKATDAALLDYFSQISAAADGIDVYVYVFRAVSGNFVSNELMARIAQLPNFVGAKVSDEPLEQLAAYRAVVPESFLIYTGGDRDLARAERYGAQGVISGISSVLPKPFRALAAAAATGDAQAIAAAQRDVDDAVDTVQGNMGRMKAAYRALGIRGGTVRMAIEAPSAETVREIERVVAAYA
ncbi:dihydrodipicolinate synthase family protein [Microterricola pindariensis]|uniref:Dihydrodipicolinate synthase family protein n=1 Tax=Microterricola pindariensis TaxID=478010 RepID=A0ABX5AWT5_9MICO|nr:dihydrodipicolinate synthase family protein [Microterricola pindariensis]PPL19350.1 dihydrodipicolinate synthase family protein [Microterricola pindariensis]